ncbi:MAG: hypothetical protein Q9223_006048 [Gallowayella weberi]
MAFKHSNDAKSHQIGIASSGMVEQETKRDPILDDLWSLGQKTQQAPDGPKYQTQKDWKATVGLSKLDAGTEAAVDLPSVSGQH